MLSDISQAQRTNTARYHLYDESKIVKFIEAESRMGWGKEVMGRY